MKVLTDEKLNTKLSSLIPLARENPEIQATFGWAILLAAQEAGIETVREIVDRIKKK